MQMILTAATGAKFMSFLTDDKVKFLEELAAKIRYDTIESVIHAGSGHIAGPLGMADIFTAMYFHILRHDPKKSDWPERSEEHPSELQSQSNLVCRLLLEK